MSLLMLTNFYVLFLGHVTIAYHSQLFNRMCERNNGKTGLQSFHRVGKDILSRLDKQCMIKHEK